MLPTIICVTHRDVKFLGTISGPRHIYLNDICFPGVD
jgi:hypothetical protein